MDDLQDPILLGRWLAGDAEALAVLVARHSGTVLAACRRQAPPEEVDDCVQAVFLVLSRRPSAATRAPVLLAWLLRVSTLVCRQARRGRERRRRAESAAAGSVETGGEQRPEALEHLDDCLQRLPARQRDAVCLHYLAGKDPIEVARELGTSRDQAYLLVHRGLERLRIQYGRRGFAVTGAVIAGLLASQARAAATAPVGLVVSLASTAPSAAASTLASGAMTAMTIQTLTPFAAAAALILAAGLAVTALAAEPPAARPPAPVAAAPAKPRPATTRATTGQAVPTAPSAGKRLDLARPAADAAFAAFLAAAPTECVFEDLRLDALVDALWSLGRDRPAWNITLGKAYAGHVPRMSIDLELHPVDNRGALRLICETVKAEVLVNPDGSLVIEPLADAPMAPATTPASPTAPNDRKLIKVQGEVAQ